MRNKSTSEICQRNTALTKCYIVQKKDSIREWKQSTESQKKTPDINIIFPQQYLSLSTKAKNVKSEICILVFPKTAPYSKLQNQQNQKAQSQHPTTTTSTFNKHT